MLFNSAVGFSQTRNCIVEQALFVGGNVYYFSFLQQKKDIAKFYENYKIEN
jgi:hypothetical protein